MTLPLKITTGVLAATVVAACALIGCLALLGTLRERWLEQSEEWDCD